jgi:hypothetical protein
VYSGSTLKVRKNLLFTAADNRAVYVSDGSKLLSAPSQNFTVRAGSDWNSEEVGGLLINGAGNHAVLVRNGSYAGLGSVYAKCFKSYLSDTASTQNTQVVVAAEANSVAEFPVVPIGTDNYYESVVGVFSPFGAAPWSSNSGALGVVASWALSIRTDAYAFMFRSSKNSSIFVEPNTVAIISAFDGGTGEWNSSTALNFYTVEQFSKLGQIPKISQYAYPSYPLSASQFSHIYSNPDATQKIMSRAGGFKYNLPLSSQYYRWWTITGYQPITLAGRTAGVWSSSGENVRKILFGIITPYTTNTNTAWNATTHSIFCTCPIVPTANGPYNYVGLTYNASGLSSFITSTYNTVFNYLGFNISHADKNSIVYTNSKT